MSAKDKSASPNENLHPVDMNTPLRKRQHGHDDSKQVPTTSRKSTKVSSDDEYEEEEDDQEIEHGEGGEEVEDDEELVVKRPRQQNARDELAVAGRVNGVHLQNFMCHANLSIDFDTDHNNCFYIGGPNGSGKSALFAAINIGLGGKGSDNDRGSSVKAYIKDGTQSAKICITLTNRGQNSHPDYGDLVSIERTINQSSSTYVLKSITRSGRQVHEEVISKKKCDVDRLVSRFNIHLSNPAFWMSQDRSRSFLNNFKPEKVYKLYQEATELEKIKQSYAKFSTNLNDMHSLMTVKQVDINKKNKELKRLQDVRQRHDQLAEDQKSLDVIQWKLLFCSIRDVEDELRVITKKIAANEEVAEENKKAMLEKCAERRDLMRIVEGLTEEMNDEKDELDGLKGEINDLKNQKEDEEQSRKHCDKEIRQKKNDIQTIRNRIGDVNRQIKKLQDKAENNDMKRKLTRAQEKFAELRERREKMEQSGTSAELLKKRFELDATMNALQAKLYDAKSIIETKKRQIDTNREHVKRAKAVKVNKINKFGSRMAEIIAEIERNRSQFRTMPKGPLGKYISIVDRKWSYPIEECIASLASQFLCNDAKDAEVLRKLFDRLRLAPQEKPSLIVSRFLGAPHQNLAEPDQRYDTVFRLLQFTDPDVHNAIIDKSSVESILLMENNREAMECMDSNRPPHNASKAFTMDGSQAFVGGPNGQYRFYAGKGGHARGLFDGGDEHVDESELTRLNKELQEEIDRIQYNEVKEANDDYNRTKREHMTVLDNLNRFEKELADVRNSEIRAERDVRDLSSSINTGDDLEEIEVLRMEIASLEDRTLKSQGELQTLEDAKLEAQQKSSPSDSKMRELTIEYKEKMDEIKKKKVRLDDLERKVYNLGEEYDRMNMANAKYTAAKQALFNDEQHTKTMKDEIVAQVNTNKLAITKPDECDDPPDLSDFPPTEIARQQYQERIKRIQHAKDEVDPTITMEYVADFKDTLKQEKMMTKRIIAVLSGLNELLKKRIELYPLLKKFTEMKVRRKFQELLDVRGNFIGDLVFDNQNETLDVVVTSCKDKDVRNVTEVPDDDDEQSDENGQDEDEFIDDEDDSDAEPAKKKSKKGKKPRKKKKKSRDLKGLSGGERSFVTAALVMALWEVMEQPFRMMDEFDVFMDMMNRKITMDLLVDMATTKFPHNQFIFFTPQGIKELNKVDGLQIFEMNKVRD